MQDWESTFKLNQEHYEKRCFHIALMTAACAAILSAVLHGYPYCISCARENGAEEGLGQAVLGTLSEEQQAHYDKGSQHQQETR